MVGHQRLGDRAVAGAARARALPASDRLARPFTGADDLRRNPGWPDRTASTAVRGGHPHWPAVGHAADPAHPWRPRSWRCCTRWYRRAAGATSASGWRAALFFLAALGRVALGAEAPTDVLVAAAIGVTIPLLGFRLFTPSDVFGQLPAWAQRPPGRHWYPRASHPPGSGGSA